MTFGYIAALHLRGLKAPGAVTLEFLRHGG